LLIQSSDAHVHAIIIRVHVKGKVLALTPNSAIAVNCTSSARFTVDTHPILDTVNGNIDFIFGITESSNCVSVCYSEIQIFHIFIFLLKKEFGNNNQA